MDARRWILDGFMHLWLREEAEDFSFPRFPFLGNFGLSRGFVVGRVGWAGGGRTAAGRRGGRSG